ncbi:hypothetical protein SAMN06264364_101107 [Quadrisphaera granulorum]|uniref:Transglycosylase-like protein with SLT domain n=1 Tax=Quadrisphaera granulorum TaxID=317664 RepID=A0A316AEX7_9ACTN|nr:phospholipase [Quadrisphaera granulorum]PWJ56132.1 hypothetical protein BXY45_101107 [Quadrisphaera granulorum]SZE94766.1 hypothetical protein SAMN06264364_101107 [Quadrisphaera granulorum]
MRTATGLLAAGAVVLTASGASLLTPTGTTSEAGPTTHERVAAVWRAAGDEAPRAAADAQLLGELAGERGQGASRSLDRAAAPTAPAASAGADSAPSAATADAGAVAVSDDPVAQAQQRIQDLQDQKVADEADTELHDEASQVSAAEARQAVAAAEQQRAAEAEQAALAAAQADPRSVAAPLVAARGWDAGQFQCLDRLWTKESGWKWSADNPSSSAYGIPQALPGKKMASHGEGWVDDPRVQIAWGLDYIADVYGTPCRAWGHSQAVNWY